MRSDTINPMRERHGLLLPALLIAALAFPMGCRTGGTAADTREITARTFRVERIVDGDTFKVIYDGELTSVRIAGINAPERKDPAGPAATKALVELIGGKNVRLEFTEKCKRDNFGRLLCKVYVGAMDVGAEMIRQGHAAVYQKRR